MVAIVNGASLGLNPGTQLVPDLSRQMENAAQGRNGEQAYVNVTTGNLVLRNIDDKLVGPGMDIDSPRTYNSQGVVDFDNNDGWQAAPYKSVRRLGASQLLRTDADGSSMVYEWAPYAGRYLAAKNDGSGRDEVYDDKFNKVLVWTDQATGLREKYQYGGAGMLMSSIDAQGNTLTYAYDSQNLLTSVTSSDGESLNYAYAAGRRLTQVSATLKSGQVVSQVSYEYDALNRLSAVGVALDPSASQSAGSVAERYVTRYAYDGASTRISGITQSDGSSLAFTYQQSGGVWRIASVVDGAGGSTRFAYDLASRTSTVTDALGVSTVYSYDAESQLTGILHGVTAANPAGTSKVGYTYGSHGDVVAIIDGRGNTTTMAYSEDGDLKMVTDSVGNITTYTYSRYHQRFTQTVITSFTLTAQLVTRYVYDDRSQHLLRFLITPEGRVTEYRYDAQGLRTSVIEYAAGTCDLSSYKGLAPGEAILTDWVAKQDMTRISRTDLRYDFRGQLQSSTVWSATDRSGEGLAGTGSTTRYIHDHHGRLLQTIAPDGASISHTVYDGLGRPLLTTTGAADGSQSISTAIRHDDASRATTLTLANGLQTTSVFDAAGRLLHQMRYAPSGEILATTRNVYDADGRLLMAEDASGRRNWVMYGAGGRKKAEIDGEGSLVEYFYNAADQLTETVRYASAVDVRRLVDGAGNPLTAYNPNPGAAPDGMQIVTLDMIRPGRTTSDARSWNVYDAMGRLSWQVDALDHATRNTYDTESRLATVTRYATPVDIAALRDGVELRLRVSGAGSTSGDVATLALATASDDRTEYFLYDRDGLLGMHIDADGFITQHIYDAAGRVVKDIVNANRETGFGNSLFNNTLQKTRAAMVPSMLVPLSSSDDIISYRYYNGAGQLVALVDGAGYLTETAYDVNGNVARIVRYANPVRGRPNVNATPAALRPPPSPQDQVTSNTWDVFGRLASQTNPEGTVTRNAYDSFGNLVGTEVAADTSERRSLLASHDIQGRLVAELSAEGAALLDGAQTVEQIDAIWAGHATHYAYDAAGRRISATDANGNRSLYFYDDADRLRFTIDGAGDVSENRYDALGRVVSTIRYAATISAADLAGMRGGLLSSPAGAAAKAALAAAEKASAAENRATRFTYDTGGHVLSRTDAAGVTTLFRYDGFGQRIAAVQPVSPTEQTTTLSHYDRRGFLIEQTTDAGNLNLVASSEYDAFGRRVRMVDASGNVVSRVYDTLGHLVQTVDPANASRFATYDAFDRVLTQTDALGHTTSYRYDSVARSIEVTTPDGVTMTTVRNRFGQTQSITDGNGNVSRFRYDRDGRLLSTTTPLSHSDASYDAGGRLIESTDPGGRRTVYRYDAADRLLSRTLDPDGLALTTTYRYDAFGEQIAVTAPSGVVTLTRYDADGRVLSQTVDPASAANPAGLNLVTRYAWDQRGAMLSVTSPGGSVTSYTYDGAGRRTQTIVDPAGLRLVTSYRYDAAGNVVSRIDANGNLIRYTYDANQRLVYTVDGAGAASYNAYDAEGRITRSTRYAARIDSSGLGMDASSADIAVRIVATPGQDATQYQVYDANGRLAYRVGASGEVSSFAYDGNGNVTDTVAYAQRIDLAVWNPDMPPPVVADPMHDSHTRTVYDATNRPLYVLHSTADGSQMAVSERHYDGNGNEVARIDYAGVIAAATPATAAAVAAALAAVADPAQDVATRHEYDAAGRLAWRVDAMGAVVRFDYDPDGNLVRQVAYAKPVAPRAAPRSVAAGSGDRITLMAYDGAGRLTGSVDATGSVTRTIYDGNGNAVQRIAFADRIEAPTDGAQALDRARLAMRAAPNNARDRVARAVFDKADRQVFSIDPCGAVTQTTYDANGNAIASIAYATLIDTAALPQQALPADLAARLQPDAADRSSHTAFDAAGRQIFSVDALGYVTQYRHDGVGRLLDTTLYAHAIGTAAAAGGAAAIVASLAADPSLDRVTRRAYDAAGNLMAVTDALGATESYTCNGLGERLTFTNKNGALWRYDYDAAGHMIRETAPAVDVARVSMAADGSLVQEQGMAINLVTELRYDALGRLTARTEAAGSPEQRVTQYRYDALGRQTGTIYEPVGVVDPDDIDRLAEGGAADARADTLRTLSNQVTYDSFGDAVANMDVAGNLSTKAYDAAGRVRYEVDALSYVTGYERNAFGDVIALTRYAQPIVPALPPQPGAAPIEASLARSGSDRTLQMQLDLCGRVTEVRQPEAWVSNGQGPGYQAAATTRTRYNAFGEAWHTAVLADASPGGNPTWAGTVQYYDARGQRIASVDALGYLTSQTYDAAGNLTGQIEYAHAIDGWNAESAPLSAGALPLPAASADDRAMLWTYDQADRRVSQTRLHVAYSPAPDGSTVVGDLSTRYAYDAVGNLTCTVSAMGDGSEDSTWIWYDALGRTRAVAAPSQDNGDGATLIPLTVFARDSHGNVVCKTDYANGAASVSLAGYSLVGVSSLDRSALSLYDRHGHEIAARDTLGNLHYASYDAAGHLAKSWQAVSDAGGAVSVIYTVFRYNALGRQTAIITPASTSQLGADGIVGVSASQAGTVTTGTRYNAFGEVTGRGTWQTGAAPDYQEFFDYDNAGRLWRSNSGDGKLSILLYNLQGQQSARIGNLAYASDLRRTGPDLIQFSVEDIDRLGAEACRRTDMQRDLLGRVVLQVLPLRGDMTDLVPYRPVIRQSYDRWGNMVAQSDPRNEAWLTRFVYNADNRVVAEIQPDGSGAIGVDSPIRRIYYDAAGRQVALRDANGNLTGQRWNAQGKLLEEIHADGGVVSYAYDIFGDRLRQTDAMGHLTRYGYDALGRNTSITHVGVGIYTASGDTITGGFGDLVSTSHYDQAGRLLAQVDGAGGVRSYAYDARSNIIATTDADGIVVRAVHDNQGRQIASQDGNGRLSTWRYNHFGTLLAHRDIGGVDYRFYYDDAGQLVSQNNDRGQALFYNYDGAGQLINIVDQATGQTSDYAYSASGKRVLERSGRPGMLLQDQTLRYDTLDRLTQVLGQDDLSLSNDYDAEGNLLHRHVNYRDQKNVLQGKDLWYAYDEMNRQLLVDGALNGNVDDPGNITEKQGHLLAYDLNGNRIEDQFWGMQVVPEYSYNRTESGAAAGTRVGSTWTSGIVTQWYRYDNMDRLASVSTIGYQPIEVSVDENGQVVQTMKQGTDESGQSIPFGDPAYAIQATDSGEVIELDTRYYDGASRLVRSGPDGGLPNDYVGTMVGSNTDLSGAMTTTTQYDAAGRVLRRTTFNEYNYSRTTIDFQRFVTQVTKEDAGPDKRQDQGYMPVFHVNTSVLSGYDAAGNLSDYRITQGDVTTYYSISPAVDGQGRLYDGYKQGEVAAVSANRDSGNRTNGSSISQYDVNGFLVGLTDTAQPANNRVLYNDAYGNVLQKVQQGHVLRQLIVDGKASGLHGYGVDPANPSKPDEHGGPPSPNYSEQADFDPRYRPVTNSYPAAAAGQYAVQSGDTLQSIAQAAYGDSSLWYEIAQANGLSGNQDMRIGQTLTIPNGVGGAHNNARTYAPYDASRMVGDTTPMLPVPAGDGNDCGPLGQVIMIVVAIVVSLYLPGIGGAIMASITSQVAGIALGVQEDFSWKAMALAAVSASVTSAVEAGANGTWMSGNATAATVARSMVSNAVTQGIGVMTGLQDRFSWASVAAAGVGAGVGSAVGQALQGTAFADAVGRYGVIAASRFAGGLAAAVARGGRVSVVQVAADAFGNALGQRLADMDWSGTARQSVSYSADEQGQDFTREKNRGNLAQIPEPISDLGSGLDPNLRGAAELRYRGMTAADLRALADEWALTRVKTNAFRETPAQIAASGPTMLDFDPAGTWRPNAMPLDVPQADASGWFKQGKTWVNEKVQSTLDSIQKINPDDFAILSPRNASAAAQYWANRHIETGNALYAIPGALAAAWADHPEEIGMVLSMGRGRNKTLDEVGSTGAPILGANGTQTASKTLWRGAGRERIDVENPNPGQRPGQLHYQDNAGNKYLYDPTTRTFPNAPNSINRLLEDEKFAQAIEKGMTRYLGEK